MRSAVEDIKERQDNLSLKTTPEIICNTELRDYAVYLATEGSSSYPKTWSNKKASIDHMTYEQKLIDAGAYIAAEIERIRVADYLHQRYEKQTKE